ncbi:MAG: metallophosphoesterase family protein [Cyclobacteriaceae bacterium]
MGEVKNLGSLNGKILVFGGAYSNLHALQRMRELAAEASILPHQVINTGDTVGYCAYPEECLSLVKDWGIHSILGNIEIQIREGQEDCGCNFDEDSRCDLLSKQWYPYAYEQISAPMKAWLHQWPNQLQFQYAGKQFAVVHGSALDTAEFIFRSTPWTQKAKSFDLTNSDVILAGHCGLPFSHANDEKLWLNAGVIGMPANDGTARVWYMILNDEDGLAYVHHSFHYDHQTAANLMKQHQLPNSYATTLSTGVWDNCEILPEEETGMQGERMEF